METRIAIGEYYHIYNRGVDKRNVFQDKEDVFRFLQSMKEFNVVDHVGGIYLRSFTTPIGPSTPKLVSFVAYCLNQNHFHFILTPLVEGGIEKFMQRLSGGYTNYFNEKNNRTGALFQGRYKRKHIETNEYLLHLSFYTNLNNRVHKDLNESWFEELPISSYPQYKGNKIHGFHCDTAIVSEQYPSADKYVQQAESALGGILKRKKDEKLLRQLLID